MTGCGSRLLTIARWVLAGAMVVVLLNLAGCSRSKEDVLARARDVKTRAELERILGRPDDIQKLGPVETWTYKASNGQVVFMIIGDNVTLQAAGGDKERKSP
jgi:hypothetical protein